MLKQCHPGHTLSEESLKFVSILLEGILYELLRLYQVNPSLQDAVKRLLGEALSEHALSEGNRAVVNFKNNFFGLDSNKIPKELKTRLFYSDLTFNTLIVEDTIVQFGYENFSDYFLIFLTAILEYLIAEIFDSAGSISMDNGRSIISKDDIVKAILTDGELLKMTNKVFAKSGSRDWTKYPLNYSKPPLLEIQKEGLLNNGGTVGTDTEYGNDSVFFSEMQQNETDKIEKDLTEFNSVYTKEKEELEKEELEEEEEEKEEIFTFTKSELEQHDKEVIEKYLKSTGTQGVRNRRY